MSTIQTFVFFDLETTGIPAKWAKVTEITFLSVTRRDIELADTENLPAINKLSFLCNPKKNIQPVAVELTGLTNQFLKNQPVFEENIKCINAFLDKPKPVCLIAHNGNRYDFKILQAEYQAANEELPCDLMCVDSLIVFRNILLEHPNNFSNIAVHDNSTRSLNESDNAINEEWQDLSTEEIQEIDKLVEHFSQFTSTTKQTKVKKIPRSHTSTPEKAPKADYKLCSIYEKLLNKKPKECHRAEADCIMLLECAIATKHEFLKYADSNSKFITHV